MSSYGPCLRSKKPPKVAFLRLNNKKTLESFMDPSNPTNYLETTFHDQQLLVIACNFGFVRK